MQISERWLLPYCPATPSTSAAGACGSSEYAGPDQWVQHDLGRGARTDVGGTTFDIDGDGDNDVVRGDDQPSAPLAGSAIFLIMLMNLVALIGRQDRKALPVPLEGSLLCDDETGIRGCLLEFLDEYSIIPISPNLRERSTLYLRPSA